MMETQLRELQLKILDMAKYFVAFCQENGLLCYLCGGGCIGAVRHKGFIPWDDDLDFFMPRSDYERLTLLWQENRLEKYILCRASKDYKDGNCFITIRDTSTTLIKPYQKDMRIPHGIAIDIFPLDAYPEHRYQRIWQEWNALVFSLFCTETCPRKHGLVLYEGSKWLLRIFPNHTLRYKIWHFAEQQMMKYSDKKVRGNQTLGVTELCAGPGYMRNWYPREAFREAVFLPFEDTQMPVPVGFDQYLKVAFGSYMELPPVEQRKPSHDFLVLDLEHSYLEKESEYE